MKGLEKVKAEFRLSTLAYNMKRAINIVGVEKMMEALAVRGFYSHFRACMRSIDKKPKAAIFNKPE